MLHAASEYTALGWSIIPVGQNEQGGWKKPLINWKDFQTVLPTENDLASWWKKWPEARVGIVTGVVSGIVVVDVDPKNNGSTRSLGLPATLVSNTGGGGWHYFYKHPGKDFLIENATGWPCLGVDIRGDGGFVVAPPSVHASGKAYGWAVGFDPSLIALCPGWLVARAKSRIKRPVLQLLDGVHEGQRNDAASRVIGLILAQLRSEDFQERGWVESLEWNRRNTPPLEEKELHSIFDSIKGCELLKRQNHEPATTRPNGGKQDTDKSFFQPFVQTHEITFFRDAKKDGYLRIKKDNAFRLISSESSEISDLYRTFFFEMTRKPPTDNQVRQVMSQLSANARQKGERINPSLRVAKENKAYFYDLANEACECIKTDATGWRVVTNQNIPLITNRLTAEQRKPENGGDINDLFRFINVKNDDDRLLLLATLTACFISDIPHPVLIFHGPKGSAKSTAMHLIKTLIDPSEVTSVQLTKNLKDIALNFFSSWLIPFDNVTFIESEVSDVLSKVVTGDSFSTRKLYSDGELHVMSFRRCLIINGINNPAKKPDLLDRAVLIEIERIDDGARRPEADLQSELTGLLPKLLGSLFDLTSRALAALPSVPRGNLARLADFDLWGRAVSMAHTGNAEPFMQAYAKNINRQSDEAIEQSSFAQCLIGYLQANIPDRVEITPTDLLKAIKAIADEDTSSAKDFPKGAAQLSRRLNELSPDLLTFGFRVTRRMTGRQRLLVIERMTKDQRDVPPVIQGNLLVVPTTVISAGLDIRPKSGSGSFDSTDATDGNSTVPF